MFMHTCARNAMYTCILKLTYQYLKKTQLEWFAKALNMMDSQSLVYIVVRNIQTNSRYVWLITRLKASPNDIPTFEKEILELFS